MKQLFTILFFMFFLCVQSQVPNWQWARTAQGTGFDEGVNCTTDRWGNVFITGQFNSSIVTFGTINVPNTGNTINVFLAKYDPLGNALWAKAGQGITSAAGITADSKGNVFISGDFEGTILFDTISLTSSDSLHSDIFIVKYDSVGNVLWAKNAGGTSADDSKCVATDVNDNLYVVGSFLSHTIAFDQDTLINSSNGNYDAFIVKYDPNGNVVWAKNPYSSAYSAITGVTADPGGDIFITGETYGWFTVFGSDTLFLTGGSDHCFVAKYDSLGNAVWVRQGIARNTVVSSFISCDSRGNAYATGDFYGSTLIFDTVLLTNYDSTHYEFYIVKYDSIGNVDWAKVGFGSASYNRSYSCSTDNFGNIWATGGFTSPTISFDSLTLNFSPNGNDPMFIVEFNPTGQVICSSVLPTGGDDESNISFDSWGNAFITGDFATSSFIIGNDTLRRTGTENVFTAKFNCGNTLSIGQPMNLFSSLLIYPNPTANTFTLQTELKNAELTVTDIRGRTVFQSAIGNPKSEINVQSWSKGLYFVTVRNREGEQRGKVVVE